MIRGFLSDVLAKWKRFRWQGLVKVWAVFMAIALVLLVESLGVHYGATRFDITYLDRAKAIPAANAIAGQKATNLLVVDSSQEGVSDAEAMLDQILLDMKVPTTTVDVADENAEFPALNHYSTIVVAMPNLDRLGEHVLQIMQWAKKGGGVMFAMTPEKTGYLDVIGPQIGIESSAYEYVATEGITPSEDFMLGGGQTYIFSDPFKSSLSVALNDRAQVEAVSSNGRTPLVWRNAVESGTAVMCNIGIYGKVFRGFYASAFSLLGSAMAYPVINSAAFYLDDFPSPVPSGNGKYIKRDYNMSISEFYSRVWWPDLVRLAERYGIRFTGVMIENYGDDTKDDPVRQTDNTQFEYYGGIAASSKRRNRISRVQPSAVGVAEYRLRQRIHVRAMAESQSHCGIIAGTDCIPERRIAGRNIVGIRAAVEYPLPRRTKDHRRGCAADSRHRQYVYAFRQFLAVHTGVRCCGRWRGGGSPYRVRRHGGRHVHASCRGFRIEHALCEHALHASRRSA